jgi:hypothetical protein
MTGNKPVRIPTRALKSIDTTWPGTRPALTPAAFRTGWYASGKRGTRTYSQLAAKVQPPPEGRH